MTAPAKLAMRAFKLLNKGGIVWVLVFWESVNANWEDISDLWG